MSDLKRHWSRRYWKYVDQRGPDECWPWTGGQNRGYGWLTGVHPADDGERPRGEYAHRLTYLIHEGELPEGLVIRHRCHHRSCCNPAHLIAGTRAENHRDSYHAGHFARARCAGFSADDIRTIRQRWAGGESQTSIARDYCCTQANISAIVHRKTWKDVA